MKRENLFLLFLTQRVDDKTFIGFGDLSNIKIYSVSPRISNSAYRPRRIFLVSTIVNRKTLVWKSIILTYCLVLKPSRDHPECTTQIQTWPHVLTNNRLSKLFNI